MAGSGKIGEVVWKPLVICPSKDLCQTVQIAFRELGNIAPGISAEYPPGAGVRSIVERNGYNVCFIDAASDPVRAQTLMAELSNAAPVIALHPRNDAELILGCIRRGACEFLGDPNPDAVRAALERLAQKRFSTARTARGALYCVIPAKPGCGASTTAANLAARMKKTGPVLLVDADHLTGSVSFILKLKPGFHLGDALRDMPRMDNDVWSRLTVSAHGMDILAAPDDPATRPEFGSQLGECLTFWRQRYRSILVDLPDVPSASDSGLIAAADLTLLVTTTELAALHALNRGMRFLEAQSVDRSKLRVVVNRYNPAAGLKTGDLKTAIGMEPFATLANDYETLQAALLEGLPAPSGSRFGASIQKLSRQLTEPPEEAPKPSSWFARLLGRST